jgi:uncharacterized protein
MSPKKPSRGKTRKQSRRRPASAGWLQALLTVLPVIALMVVAVFLLRPAPPATPPVPSVAPAAPLRSQAPPAPAAEGPGEQAIATEERPAVMPRAKPRLAIIMDDLGRDLVGARTLLAIDLPVTFAILPGETHAMRVAQLAHQQGREVLIHLPMEPRGYPVVDPGDDALLVEQSPEELRRRFQRYLQQVPHATGANNHMGSRFTEHAEGLATVFAEMKMSGLFFVDSLTSSQSVALASARQSGLRAVGRDLFLDNVQDVERIIAEIRRLVAMAEKRGQAVGICHPYPQTMEALRRAAPFLRERVEVVPVSSLLPP